MPTAKVCLDRRNKEEHKMDFEKLAVAMGELDEDTVKEMLEAVEQ